jgi:hypothetical protein
MRTCLVVPTRNPGTLWPRWMAAVQAQALAGGTRVRQLIPDFATFAPSPSI